MEVPVMSNLKIYGANWCEDTQHTRQHLDALGVPYDYINIESIPGARDWVKRHNDGNEKTPTIDLAGNVLSEPNDVELDQALRQHGLMA
jgi:mycoredoxin